MTRPINPDKMVAFEVQTCKDGAWKIEAVFDDRELAEVEAERLGTTDRYSTVRVVEEIYDRETQDSTSRTVFRASRPRRENNAVPKREKQGNTQVHAGSMRNRTAASPRRRTRPKQKQQGRAANWLVVTSLKISGVFLLAIAILYAAADMLDRF